MSSEQEPPPPYADEPAQLATAARRTFSWTAQPAPDVHRVLQRLLNAEQPNPWWNGVSVFLALPGDVTIASAVTPSVTSADERQLRLNSGPALHTISTQQDLLVDDTAVDRRWPKWSASMATCGWRSILTKSVGSLASGAALCLYAYLPRAFTLEAHIAAEAFAQRTRAAVTAARDLRIPTDHGHDPQTVVARAILHVMECSGVNSYDAFELVWARAQAHQQDLQTAAAQLMWGRHGLA